MKDKLVTATFIFVAAFILIGSLVGFIRGINAIYTTNKKVDILYEDLQLTERQNASLQENLDILQNQNDLLKANLAATRQGAITGYAVLDIGIINQLGFEDVPAQGLVVQLYKVEMTGDNRKTTLVSEVKVNSEGVYLFKVTSGDYFVAPLLAIPGYPAWDSAAFLKGRALSVTDGSVVIGPTLLIQQNIGKG